MSTTAPFWIRAPHLSAGALAVALAGGLFWLLSALHFDRRLAHLTASDMLEVKDQGLALQREAFADKDLLPIYGSSEFRNDSPYAGRMFFATHPTGFGLFIVGKAGSKTLIIAHRLGALGDAIRGRKVVIILSPTWFLSEKEGVGFYEGNFSALQAEELIFKSSLSPDLKRAFATEFLKYPKALAGHEFLRFELKRLTDRTPSLEDRIALGLGGYVGDFLNAIDECSTTLALSPKIVQHPTGLSLPAKTPKQKPAWDDLTKSASERHSSADLAEEYPDGNGPSAEKLALKLGGKKAEPFQVMLERSDEWYHLDLLLRTMRELGVKPLIISIPINATSFATAGVKPVDRELYYAMLRDKLRPYHFPFETFETHETDPSFFNDEMGHPSAKGWMYFNRLIDQFYHDKLPATLD
ncbi:MAG TPA: D-alanyl-lipoteichoic acid biosynthesis protein DltD [Chthoniobacterales bacterium]